MDNIFTDIPASYSVEALLWWTIAAFGLVLVIGIIYRVVARRRLAVLVREWEARNADEKLVAYRKSCGLEPSPEPSILDTWEYITRVVGSAALAATLVTAAAFLVLRVSWMSDTADSLGAWLDKTYGIEADPQQALDLRWNQEESVTVVYEGKTVAISLLNVEGEDYEYGAPSEWVVVYHKDAVRLDELDR